jgi:hypothetical protein
VAVPGQAGGVFRIACMPVVEVLGHYLAACSEIQRRASLLMNVREHHLGDVHTYARCTVCVYICAILKYRSRSMTPKFVLKEAHYRI